MIQFSLSYLNYFAFIFCIKSTNKSFFSLFRTLLPFCKERFIPNDLSHVCTMQLRKLATKSKTTISYILSGVVIKYLINIIHVVKFGLDHFTFFQAHTT